MKMNIIRICSLLTALIMALAAVVSVAAGEENAGPAASGDATPLVLATSPLSMKFDPFFHTTAYDGRVADLTNSSLLASDRNGDTVRNGIDGEVIEYNGTDYTYYSMGNVEVVQNDDGTTDYNLTMRDDLKFSDGEPITIDDYIFTLYVLSDPTYDGISTFYTLPIEGMEEYYKGMSPLGQLLIEAGKDNTDFSDWSEEEQQKFWDEDLPKAGEALAREIIEYCLENYAEDNASDIGATADEVRADDALAIKLAMNLWGYGDAWTEDADAADFWNAIVEAYDGDIITAAETETASTPLLSLLGDEYLKGIAGADDKKSISGVIRTGDYSCTLHMTSFDATAIYKIGITVAPMHYYGDKSLYDYENESFGFIKGDLSGVRKHTSNPEVGCGPYVFNGYNNGVVTLKANENYYQGKPAVDTLLMKEAIESDFVPGIVTGTFDIAELGSLSDDVIKAIKDANGGELTGDALTTYLIDYLGYGYIGINANEVKVGDDPSSEASKNLRKGIMTVLSVYRDTVINSYYGDRAYVIQYPISSTSWAAPKPTDAGYTTAYSVGVDGKPIYAEGMSEEQKYEAALDAAVEYFKAAGYTWDGEKFTDAPEGASLIYDMIIPGEGIQDHPSYGIAIAASEQLGKIGITLQVNDVGASTWNDMLESGTAQLWAASWGSGIDPDMYQVYHSSNANGQNTNSNHYQITDDKLDQLILDARSSDDKDFRRAEYKQAMDIVMDWGVELPVYQRKNAYVTSTQRLDNGTVPGDVTPFYDLLIEVEKIRMK